MIFTDAEAAPVSPRVGDTVSRRKIAWSAVIGRHRKRSAESPLAGGTQPLSAYLKFVPRGTISSIRSNTAGSSCTSADTS